MRSNTGCHKGTITGGTISADPTATDTNYPIGFIGWTPENKAFLHVGSGTWIDITEKAESVGGGEQYLPKKAKHVGK